MREALSSEQLILISLPGNELGSELHSQTIMSDG